MKLTELNPKFLDSGGEGVTNADGSPAPERRGVALAIDCPCGCGRQLCVPFKNPFDGGPSIYGDRGWTREGDTFDNLTLSPSIQRMDGCGWHGFVRNGETIKA
jgi:hypothetical protein